MSDKKNSTRTTAPASLAVAVSPHAPQASPTDAQPDALTSRSREFLDAHTRRRLAWALGTAGALVLVLLGATYGESK